MVLVSDVHFSVVELNLMYIPVSLTEKSLVVSVTQTQERIIMVPMLTHRW